MPQIHIIGTMYPINNDAVATCCQQIREILGVEERYPFDREKIVDWLQSGGEPDSIAPDGGGDKYAWDVLLMGDRLYLGYISTEIPHLEVLDAVRKLLETHCDTGKEWVDGVVTAQWG